MAQSKLELVLEMKDRLSAGLRMAKDAVSTATADMKQKLHSLKTAGVQAFSEMKDRIPGLGTAIEMLRNPIIAVAAGAVALGTAFVKCTKMANDWHEQMANINVTAEQTPAQLRKLSDELMAVGARNAAPLEEVPKAYAAILGALDDVNTATATLEPTLRASKAGFTDIETTARAATSTMMAAGVESEKAFDVLFMTVKKGNAEFKDVANYLPKVIPMARTLGFSLEETAGAFASLTAKLNPNSASTALEGAIRAFSNEKVVAKLKGIGINVFDVRTGASRPLLDIIKDMNAAMTGLTDRQRMAKMGMLDMDQTATLGISAMMQDIDGLAGSIDATTNSQGALNNAYRDAAGPLDSWKIAQNQIRADMIKIGEIFLPVLGQIGLAASAALRGIGAAGAFLWEWKPVIIGIAGAFAVLNAQTVAAGAGAGILAVKTGILAAKQWLWNVALSANPVGIVIVAIGALIGAIAVMAKKFTGWVTLWEAIKVTLVNSFRQYVSTWMFGIRELWSGIQIFWAKLKSFGEFAGQLFTNIGKAIKAALSGNFSEARDILKQEIKTKSSIEVGNLEAARNANRAAFASESVQRAKEIAEAWKNVSIKKKQEEAVQDAKSPVTPPDSPVVTGDPDAAGASGGKDAAGHAGNAAGSADAVAGSARQVRNIYVTIDAFNKGGINAGNTEGLNGLTVSQVESWFNGMLQRAIRNIELSY
ncbi:MAG: phage tail tape measure protein [Bacteroidales bacterium]|jgi:TP901 family phage tail tape measure protein|nr:phage tail tape measure protein [Bacteroidales bacterium]